MTAETVDHMIRDRWDVITWCAACSLALRVDLAVIQAVAGGGTSLWNRQTPCKRVGCRGKVEFQGRPPQLRQHIVLRAEWPAGRS